MNPRVRISWKQLRALQKVLFTIEIQTVRLSPTQELIHTYSLKIREVISVYLSYTGNIAIVYETRCKTTIYQLGCKTH